METLLGILLFIGAIGPNSEYTESEINDLEQIHTQEIQVVENNPQQSHEAEVLYQDYGSTIHVLDDVLL